jgi:hypothetical protein
LPSFILLWGVNKIFWHFCKTWSACNLQAFALEGLGPGVKGQVTWRLPLEVL